MKNLIIKDKKGREIVRMNSRYQVAVARYTDLDQYTKDYIVEVYTTLTGNHTHKLMDFLNYKSEQNEFCS